MGGRRVSWADMHGGRALEQVTRFQGEAEDEVYYPFERHAFEQALSAMARVVPVPESSEEEEEAIMEVMRVSSSESSEGGEVPELSSSEEEEAGEGEVPGLMRDGQGWGAFGGVHIAQALEGLNSRGAVARSARASSSEAVEAWVFGNEDEDDEFETFGGWGGRAGEAGMEWPDFSGGLLGFGTLVTGTLVAFGAAGWWRARVLAQQLRAKEQELASALASLLVSGRVAKGRPARRTGLSR